MNHYKIPTHSKSPKIVNSIIEIEEGSKNKYEYDGQLGVYKYDRCLTSAMVYPASYGFIPGTLCDDGDPLDILVIAPEPIKRATLVETKVLGVLDMEDEGSKDYKIVGVPSFYTRKYANLRDLDPMFLRISKNFFAHYKDLSLSGKKVKVKDWHDRNYAYDIINNSLT